MLDGIEKAVHAEFSNLIIYLQHNGYRRVSRFTDHHEGLRYIEEVPCKSFDELLHKYKNGYAHGILALHFTYFINVDRAIYTSAIPNMNRKIPWNVAFVLSY